MAQVDIGAFYQAPAFYLLRNACSPGLAAIIVQGFKNTRYMKQRCANQSSSAPPQQNVDIENLTIFDFLKRINNKGKKGEGKRKKDPKNDEDDQEGDTGCRSSRLNNLKENEESLKMFKVCDLMDEANFPELIENFRKCDVTFLLNLITNEILYYEVPNKVFSEINLVKNIRNCVYHSGRKVECHDFKDKFQQLCSALKELYTYLKWDISELDKEIERANCQHGKRSSCYAPNIFDELRDEMATVESAELESWGPKHYIMPTTMDTGEMAIIENFEQSLGQDKKPVLLCGPPGCGKTTLLRRLAQKFYSKNLSLQCQLMVYLDSSYRIINECDFREAVSKKIRDYCPKTIEKYGVDFVLCMIEIHADDILFLVNWNINSLEDKRSSMYGGKWVVCSQFSYDEPSSLCHVVRVLPLNDTQVKQMLRGFIPDDNDEYQLVTSLYDECDYKGLINCPDMVAIFSKIRMKTPCNDLVLSYLRYKLDSVPDLENKCRALGKIAFNSILCNKKYYSERELSGIALSSNLMDLFVQGKNNSFVFRYRIVEDVLAAKYIVMKPDDACKEWIRQVPLFKRVFKFVCAEWCENEEVLLKNLRFLRSYLEKYFGVKSYRKQEAESSKDKSYGKRSMAEDILDKDAEFSKADSFTKWTFLISLLECCKFQSRMMELLCKLLSFKTAWVFKCKFLDEQKVSILSVMLKKVQLLKPTVMKIESGSVVGTLNKVWQMLSELPGIYKYATVQITIRHREFIPVSFDSNLSRLPSYIADHNISEPLYVTIYKGPFICPTTPDFLKCCCMRRLEVLDVCVYDVATLAQVLACQGLESLKAVVIKVDLRLSEKESESFAKLRLPDFADRPRTTLTLTIRYFDGLQRLLQQVENPLQLQSLIIHNMHIKDNFKLDISAFKNLESLFIRFNPYAIIHQGEGKQQPMEIKHGAEGNKCEEPMETNQPSRSQELLPRNWPFQLAVNLNLPKNLERLLLRNMEFCDDSNMWQMIQLWEKNIVQRLTLLDSKLSVKGVRNILRKFGDDGTLEQAMKRAKVSRNDSMNVRECLTKKPRLDKEERERRRKEKPSGKELIITSQCKLCGNCQQFPCCCCQPLEGNSLEDVVHLIEDAYHYDILSLSYYSDIITVRKDMCGDLRVHCPLTRLDDYTISNFEIADSWLKSLFHSLTLAQCIRLDCTKLTHNGAWAVLNKIISLKAQYCKLSKVEPFSFSLSSDRYHDTPDDEVKNSTFIKQLIDETCLVQFKFSCCDGNRCHYIKKTRDANIYLNDERLKV